LFVCWWNSLCRLFTHFGGSVAVAVTVALAKEAGDKVATADAVAFVVGQGFLDCVEAAAAVVDGLGLGAALT